jgi:hypothetical protein
MTTTSSPATLLPGMDLARRARGDQLETDRAELALKKAVNLFEKSKVTL